jgi:TP901 family phage tail tape measure protein
LRLFCCMALEESGLKLEAENAAAYISDISRAEAATADFVGGLVSAAGSTGSAAATMGKAADQVALRWDEAAQRWRTASGSFASNAQMAAAGVAKASDDIAEKGGKGFQALEEIATGAMRRIGEVSADFAANAAQAIGAFVVDSVSQAGDFEAGMNRFGAVVGSALGESGQSLEDFKQLFLDMGAQTQFSAAQAQDAAINLAKGGIEPAAIAAGGLEAALNLAAAGELDLATAAEITAKQYGVWVDASASAAEKAAFMAESADLLAQAANASTVDVDELALGLANAGGVAKVSGVSFRDTVTTMALLAPGFSSAADAGTSYKTLLARLIPTTSSQADAMAELGLLTAEGTSKFYDAEGAFIGMEAAAQLLQNATAGLSAEQKQMALQAIFESDAIRAGAILAEQGAEGFQRMAASMAAAGTAAEQAAARNQGFNFALESAKGSLETFGIVAGSLALPALTSLLEGAVIPFINAATEFAAALGDPTTQLGQMAEIVTSAVVPGLIGLTAATIAYAVTQLPMLIAGVAASTTAFAAQAAAIAATLAPLALIAAAVGAVVWAWNDYNAKIEEGTTKLLESREWWNASTEALNAYSSAQLQTNANVAAAAATVEQLRTQIETSTDSLARRMAAGAVTDAQYQQEITHINQMAGSLQVATGYLNDQIDATAREAAASMTATSAMATMGGQHDILTGQVSLTAEEVQKLGDQLQTTYQEGGQALQAFASTEAEFLTGVTERRTAHEEAITALMAEKAAAQTEAQQTAIDERIAAEEAAYATQEANAATAYAEQQAAQQAHLGQMLLDYTNAQVQLGNISAEKAAEITNILVTEYGIQEDSAATSFANMAAAIDEYANSGSASADTLVSALRENQNAAVETEQAMTAMSKEYVATAVANFVEKGGEASDYAGKLRDIPSEVKTTVTTEYRETGSKGGGGRGGEMEARASGGPIKKGQPYLVGEEGPEIVIPDTAGQVLDADATASIGRSTGDAVAQRATIPTNAIAESGEAVGRTLADSIAGAIGQGGQAIGDATWGATGGAQDAAGTIGDAIMRDVGDGFVKGSKGASDAIKHLGDEAHATAEGAFDGVGEKVGDAMSGAIGGALEQLEGEAKTAFEAIGKQLDELADEQLSSKIGLLRSSMDSLDIAGNLFDAAADLDAKQQQAQADRIDLQKEQAEQLAELQRQQLKSAEEGEKQQRVLTDLARQATSGELDDGDWEKLIEEGLAERTSGNMLQLTAAGRAQAQRQAQDPAQNLQLADSDIAADIAALQAEMAATAADTTEQDLQAQKDRILAIANATQDALDEAQRQADALGAVDPTAGLEFLRTRQAQIAELADLERQAATTDDDRERERLNAKIELTKRAQALETEQLKASLADRASELDALGSELETTGNTMVDSMITGIQDRGNDLATALAGVIEQALGAANAIPAPTITPTIGDAWSDIPLHGSVDAPMVDDRALQSMQQMFAQLELPRVAAPVGIDGAATGGAITYGGDTYYIDARGAAPGVEQAIERILDAKLAGKTTKAAGMARMGNV